MTSQTLHLNVPISAANRTVVDHDSQVVPIISHYVTSIIAIVFGTFMGVATGFLGMLTNSANICVYLKLGLTETTNISFFVLSICDFFMSASSVVMLIFYSRLVSGIRLPTGAMAAEIGSAAGNVYYPCLGCSAWITAVLSTERCLCIAMPLKVKEVVTPRRTTALILIMVVYEITFSSLMFALTGPPYDAFHPKRMIYLICSFSVPSLFCFFIVVIATSILVIRLRQNLAWRSEAAKQPAGDSGTSKEQKAARSVTVVCTIFIICFIPNVFTLVAGLVFPDSDLRDPYYGNLSRLLFIFSMLFQGVNSSVNIIVYYRMSTRYREVFVDLFWRKSR